jgi:hypothetical protein
MSSTTVTCYHSVGHGNVPAIDVKVQLVGATPDLERALDAREDAESIRQEAFELAQEGWWRDAKELGDETFGSKVEIATEGRSGGWLVTIGLDDPTFWDRRDVARWKKFEKKIESMLKPREITSRYSAEIENLLAENE